MSLMTPPGQDAIIDDAHFHWTEPREERRLFDERSRTLKGISGDEFLRMLDRGEFDRLLAEDGDRDLAYLAALSDLGR